MIIISNLCQTQYVIMHHTGLYFQTFLTYQGIKSLEFLAYHLSKPKRIVYYIVYHGVAELWTLPSTISTIFSKPALMDSAGYPQRHVSPKSKEFFP